MKGLDTPVLLALLAGEPRAVALARRWRGEELATTEIHMLELAAIAAAGPSRNRSGRMASLSRLRRRITVLPLERHAFEEAGRRLGRGESPENLYQVAALATLEAAGCNEFVTDDPSQVRGKWRFRCSKP